MFRALLWKEWRELWMLPVAAAPLAAMSFFIAKEDIPLLRPVVWEAGFSLWLIITAVYIPTHVFAREKNVDTFAFISAKPVDRFRLWWVRLFAGVVALAVIGLVLCGAVTVLSHFYEKAGGFEPHKAKILGRSIAAAFLVFSLSSFFASLHRRQISAVISLVLVLPLLWVIWVTGRRHFYMASVFNLLFSEYPRSALVRALVFSPALLFGSLVAYTRGNLRKRTKKNLVLAYAAPATVAVAVTAAGVVCGFGETPFLAEKTERERREQLRIEDVSAGGTRVLVSVPRVELLVAADLSARRAYVIHRGDLQRAMLMDNSKKVVYVKYRKLGPFFLSYRIVLSDFEGTDKRELLGSDHTVLWAYPPWVQESNDGGYVGIVANANELDRKEGYVAIADAAGAILGRYEYPVLEGTSMYPVGWDYESRFYFGKYADKPSERRTFWHVRPDDVVPQRVSFLDAVLTRNFSPDGKWMTYYRPTDNRLLAEGWLYNVVKKSAQLASGQTSSFQWSHDSRFIAFAEHEEEPTEVEPDEPAAIESPSLLIIYEPKSGERFSVSPHRKSDIYVYSWSLSDRYLLVGIAELYSKDGEIIPQQKRHEMPYVFSLETKEFIPVKPPHEAFRFPVRMWIAGDRLLWGANIRMLVSDWDGSNPEEILRYERGRLYAFGKEQS